MEEKELISEQKYTQLKFKNLLSSCFPPQDKSRHFRNKSMNNLLVKIRIASQEKVKSKANYCNVTHI